MFQKSSPKYRNVQRKSAVSCNMYWERETQQCPPSVYHGRARKRNTMCVKPPKRKVFKDLNLSVCESKGLANSACS